MIVCHCLFIFLETEKLKHKKPKKSKPNPAPIPQGPQSKHPVMLLNELRPGIQYACTGEHANPGSNGKTFIMEVRIQQWLIKNLPYF